MKIALILFYFVFLLNGCIDDAPRDNPLDPQASGVVKNGSLTGRVLIANTSVGMSGVTITSTTEHISVQTDVLGYFTFSSLSSGVQQFICTKQNCSADTFSVAIQMGQTIEVFRNLNSAPVTTFKQILTRKIDQYFPGPQYFVEVSAGVTDPNGIADLDSVWFSVADTILYPLIYSVASKTFIATIYKYDIPTNTIQWLVGKPLTIISKDIHNAVNVSDPFYVTRVIENEASPISPSPFIESLVSADSVIFRWSPPSVTYNYSYTLTLSQVASGTQNIVWSYAGLNSFYEEKAYDGASALTSGSYVWTIAMVDDFGNYGSSKESAFTVK